MRRQEKHLGDLLLEKGLISGVQLKDALKQQYITKDFLGSILVSLGFVKEQDLLEVLSKQFNMPMEDISERYLDFELIRRFGSSLIIDNHCAALFADDKSATFAIVNPLDAWTLSLAQEAAKGRSVKFVLVSQKDMKDATRRYQEYIKKFISKTLE